MQAERLLKEQCNIEERKSIKTVSLKKSEEISSGSMQNPADENATYRKKNGKEFIGYLNHTAETCNPENPVQVITDTETTENNIDDATTGTKTLSRIKEETDVETMIQDGGFHSSDAVESAKKLGVKIHQTAIRGKKQKPDLLNSEDFKISDKGLIESCPNGNRPNKQILKDGKVLASFDKLKCASCAKNDKCIVYNQPKQCKIIIDENRKFLDSRIKKIIEESTLKLNRLRPAVEGLMEKMKPKKLDGRTVFRGKQKVKNRMLRRAIGLNFNRYVSLKNKKPKIWAIFSQLFDKFEQNYNFIRISCLELA